MQITPTLTVHETAIEEKFLRSSGPGGQNVNKVETAVQLRFDLNRSGLPPEICQALARRFAQRITADGVLVVNAQKFRTREANRHEARERLAGMIREAARRPRTRHATKPTLASQQRRIRAKRQRSEIKRARRISRHEE